MKTCPMCAESIKPDALVCRYCGHKFAPEEVAEEQKRLAAKRAEFPNELNGYRYRIEQDQSVLGLDPTGREIRFPTWQIFVFSLRLDKAASMTERVAKAKTERRRPGSFTPPEPERAQGTQTADRLSTLDYIENEGREVVDWVKRLGPWCINASLQAVGSCIRWLSVFLLAFVARNLSQPDQMPSSSAAMLEGQRIVHDKQTDTVSILHQSETHIEFGRVVTGPPPAATTTTKVAPASSTPQAQASNGQRALYSPRSGSVAVWKDTEAAKKGMSIVAQIHDHMTEENARYLLPYIACFPNSGDHVLVTDGGVFLSDIIVTDGPEKDCHGTVENDSPDALTRP